MAFPRMIALAERAWAAEPAFVRVSDSTRRTAIRDAAWNRFANALGQRELPRLHFISGKVQYRVPPPGVHVENGLAQVNVAFPGLSVRAAYDGQDPGANSERVDKQIDWKPGLKLRAYDSSGHGSRSVEVRDATK